MNERVLWKKEFRLLLKRSVVTGIPELLATRDNFRRLLRGFVLIFCLTGFFYFTYLFLKVYWTYPTTMDVVIETPEKVDVPAITLCSYNGIKASTFCSQFPDLCSPQRNYSAFCQRNHDFYCDKNYVLDSNDTVPAISPFQLPNLTRYQFKHLGNQPFDLIESCKIRKSSSFEYCSNETKWVSVFDTMGLPNNCYSINSLIGNIEGQPSSMRAKSNREIGLDLVCCEVLPLSGHTRQTHGQQVRLIREGSGQDSVNPNCIQRIELKIKTITEDTFYTATPTALQISVHNPRILQNPFRKGFTIKPCFNYFVYVSKTINQLLPYPYDTNCIDYLSGWKARGGYGPLSKTECREECLLNVSLAKMKCVDPFFVTYPNTASICTVPANTKRIFSQCNQGCLRACYREDVTVEVEEHASLLAKNHRGTTRKCLSMVIIAFNRMEVKKFAYYPKYQTIELFGYIGGFLGVWLGISLLAITDLVESIYLFIKVIRSWQHRRRSRKILLSRLGQTQLFDPYRDDKDLRMIKIL